MNDIKRPQAPDTTSEDVFSLVALAGPHGAPIPSSLADDLADRTEFTLDADAWEAWEALNERPARDLPGLRAFMRKPVPFVKE